MAAGVTMQYDNQLAALDVRASAAPAGLPLLMYAELGWEDADCSWGDPELVAGVLTAPASPLPIALPLRVRGLRFGGALVCLVRHASRLLVPAHPLPERVAGGRRPDRASARRIRAAARAGRSYLEPRPTAGGVDPARLDPPRIAGICSRTRARAARPAGSSPGGGGPGPRVQLEASWLREEGSGWTWRCAALELRGFL